jgi:hypothetical protein
MHGSYNIFKKSSKKCICQIYTQNFHKVNPVINSVLLTNSFLM